MSYDPARDGLTPEFKWIGQHSPVNGRERKLIDAWPMAAMALGAAAGVAVVVGLLWWTWPR
jgi:hypothetical protein